jgi:hypothetical protein
MEQTVILACVEGRIHKCDGKRNSPRGAPRAHRLKGACTTRPKVRCVGRARTRDVRGTLQSRPLALASILARRDWLLPPTQLSQTTGQTLRRFSSDSLILCILTQQFRSIVQLARTPDGIGGMKHSMNGRETWCLTTRKCKESRNTRQYRTKSCPSLERSQERALFFGSLEGTVLWKR